MLVQLLEFTIDLVKATFTERGLEKGKNIYTYVYIEREKYIYLMYTYISLSKVGQ